MKEGCIMLKRFWSGFIAFSLLFLSACGDDVSQENTANSHSTVQTTPTTTTRATTTTVTTTTVTTTPVDVLNEDELTVYRCVINTYTYYYVPKTIRILHYCVNTENSCFAITSGENRVGGTTQDTVWMYLSDSDNEWHATNEYPYNGWDLWIDSPESIGNINRAIQYYFETMGL